MLLSDEFLHFNHVFQPKSLFKDIKSNIIQQQHTGIQECVSGQQCHVFNVLVIACRR